MSVGTVILMLRSEPGRIRTGSPDVVVEEAGVLGERGALAAGRLMRGDELRPVELLGQLDVDQLVALQQVLDVVVALEHGERDRDPEHRVRIGRRDELAELRDGHQRPDGLVDDHRVDIRELPEPEVDRLLPRRPADDAGEPRSSKPWLAISSRVSSRWRLRAGDDDPVDIGDDARLLEDVDDEWLATEQEELLRERAADAFPDAPGEHDHPDLHADLRRLGLLR